MEFQQSRTYSNLQAAFEEELMASSKYRIYGDQARREGFIEIGNIYDVLSRNCFEHARIWLRQINQGTLPDTEQSLQLSTQEASILGNETYRDFARIAREEGFDEISALFNGIANIELNHSLRTMALYEDVARNEVFCKPEQTLWICMECGNIMFGECAPEICPVCGFPQGYYRVYAEQEIV